MLGYTVQATVVSTVESSSRSVLTAEVQSVETEMMVWERLQTLEVNLTTTVCVYVSSAY